MASVTRECCHSNTYHVLWRRETESSDSSPGTFQPVRNRGGPRAAPTTRSDPRTSGGDRVRGRFPTLGRCHRRATCARRLAPPPSNARRLGVRSRRPRRKIRLGRSVARAACALAARSERTRGGRARVGSLGARVYDSPTDSARPCPPTWMEAASRALRTNRLVRLAAASRRCTRPPDLATCDRRRRGCAPAVCPGRLG